jgi:multiple sugar transport system substrate-binding protein
MRRDGFAGWLSVRALPLAVGVVAAVAVPLVLSACSAPSPPTPTAGTAAGQAAAPATIGPGAAQGPVQLRFAWWGSQDRHNRTIRAIELFQQMHPNISITYEFANFQDYFTKMATYATGGNLPDLMQQDYATIGQWTSNGLLLPLDDYVNDGTINLSDVPKASIEGGRLNGKLIAVNLGNNSQSIVLDLDAFQKAGIPIPAETWTWDDFEKIAMDLHSKLGIYGAGPNLDDIQMWKSLHLGYGQWGFSTDGKSLGYTDDQLFVAYLKMLQRLQDAGAIPDQQEQIAQYRVANVEALPIVSSKAAMQYMWSNQLVAAWTAAGDNRHFKLTTLPRPKDGGKSENYLKPSQFISITKDTKHPREAAMFIDFMTNDVEANKILLGERGVPISPKIQEVIKPLLTQAQMETEDYLALIEKVASPLPPPDPAAQLKLNDNVYLPQLVDPVLLKQTSPEAAVSQFRKDATALLASP